ncbi:MAG: hypothetical protein LBG26_02675 [Treponema sp.]|nr:hypothetical protein [Treponema sp.]
MAFDFVRAPQLTHAIPGDKLKVEMKILEIKNIVRKDVPIYYRRLFSGTLVLELINKTQESRIDFTVETKPTGINEIIVNGMEPVDYPLLPLTKEIKKYISLLDENGGLPA